MQCKHLSDCITGYVGACHAGVGEEGLCYSERIVADYAFAFFYDHNAHLAHPGGSIAFMLPWDKPRYIPSAVELRPLMGSNVHHALIPMGYQRPTMFALGENNTLYIPAVWDDSHANGTHPYWDEDQKDLSNFYLCWQWIELYWWYSVAWVATHPPHNPSCEPVTLTLEYHPSQSD